MDIRVTRGKSDDIIDRIIAVLRTYGKDHPRAAIDLYRQNSVSVRIRIIDDAFGGMNRPERSDMVWRYLVSLSEDDQSEISSVILLTSDETERSFANFDTENPVRTPLGQSSRPRRQKDVDPDHVDRQLRADVVLEPLNAALVAELAMEGQEHSGTFGGKGLEA